MKNLGGYEDPIVFCHMSHFQEPSPRHYSLFERTFRMAWNKFSLSQILKTANLILVVTPLEKRINVMMGADPKNCFLFPSGVDEGLFLKYAAADIEEFLNFENDPFGTCTAGIFTTLRSAAFTVSPTGSGRAAMTTSRKSPRKSTEISISESALTPQAH
jgi:hypothetical protein